MNKELNKPTQKLISLSNLSHFYNVDSKNELFECDDNFLGCENLTINLEKDSNFNLSLICKNKNIKSTHIVINLAENALFNLYFADFCEKEINLHVDINLNGIGAKTNVIVSSVSTENDIKNFEINVNHNCRNTVGIVNCYGVCKNSSKISFIGISHIKNGCVKSKSSQNVRGLVFDETAQTIARPILKIDENDIEASHSGAVGKISDEYLFYLTSRGLSELEAKTLITYGYIKPVFSGFLLDETKEELNRILKRKLEHGLE